MRTDNDFYFEVARGARKGMTRMVLCGINADVDAAEDVWVNGGDVPAFDSVGFLIEAVSSDNTNDKAAGTGALTILVKGVTIAGVYQEETITLNGTSAVAGLKTWGFINSAEVATAGSSGTNAGTITVRVASAGATKAVIDVGRSVSDGAFFYVPAGYRFIVESVQFWATTSGTIIAGIAHTEGTVLKTRAHVSFTNVAVLPQIQLLAPYGGGTLLKVRVLSVSAGNQSVGAVIRGVLLDSTAV